MGLILSRYLDESFDRFGVWRSDFELVAKGMLWDISDSTEPV